MRTFRLGVCYFLLLTLVWLPAQSAVALMFQTSHSMSGSCHEQSGPPAPAHERQAGDCCAPAATATQPESCAQLCLDCFQLTHLLALSGITPQVLLKRHDSNLPDQQQGLRSSTLSIEPRPPR